MMLKLPRIVTYHLKSQDFSKIAFLLQKCLKTTSTQSIEAIFEAVDPHLNFYSIFLPKIFTIISDKLSYSFM